MESFGFVFGGFPGARRAHAAGAAGLGDFQALRLQAIEELLPGAGHPGLRPEAADLGIERLTAGFVQMRRHLVEKQDGGGAEDLGHGPGVGEDEADEQRLLLAGGGEAGGDALGGVGGEEVVAMRAEERAAGGEVAPPALLERGGQALGVARAFGLEREVGAREGAGGGGGEAGEGGGAVRGEAGAVGGELGFERLNQPGSRTWSRISRLRSRSARS